MSRKHYIGLAEIVGNTLATAHKAGNGIARDEVYAALYEPLTAMLAADNPNFDRLRFSYAVAQAEDARLSDDR